MSTENTIRKRVVDALEARYGLDEATAIYRELRRSFGGDGNALSLKVDQLLLELLAGRPLQYVLGEAWFYGLSLHVDESVLIPRPETEELVDLIVKRYARKSGLSVLDIGTGSGCNALALKKNLLNAKVQAVDISESALKVARANGEHLGLDVAFVEGDIRDGTGFWTWAWPCYDIIVSNPPYITAPEADEMEEHVLAYEPDLALFAPEGSPLFFYDHIASFAVGKLMPGGGLFVEINAQFGTEVAELFRNKGFKEVSVLKDMQGLDRMVIGFAPSLPSSNK